MTIVLVTGHSCRADQKKNDDPITTKTDFSRSDHVGISLNHHQPTQDDEDNANDDADK